MSDKEKLSVWKYKFPEPTYNLPAPWVSSMAQGLGIKVLALAHEMTSQEKFMDAALMALKALMVPFVYDDHEYWSKSCSARGRNLETKENLQKLATDGVSDK